VRSKAATPLIERENCIQHPSMFVAKVRSILEKPNPERIYGTFPGFGTPELARGELRLPQAAILSDAAGSDSTTSSVTTLKRTRWAGPKAVEIATSAASRPLAITMRPIRG
jgi:hypothetical protein